MTLGMGNSRMKDYFDLLALAREGAADPRMLAKAFRANFNRRQTPIPNGMPLGLGDAFAQDRSKQSLTKNHLDAPPLEDVLRELRSFLAGPLRDASREEEGEV